MPTILEDFARTFRCFNGISLEYELVDYIYFQKNHHYD